MNALKTIATIGCLVISSWVTATTDSVTFYLLRGIGRESGHWGTHVPEAIRANMPNARFVMMDLPGAGKYHNQSALPTIEKMADFLREQYHPQNDSLSKRVIVATSLAGNVALEWVSTYPTDFHGAVLISSSLKGVCKGKERVKPEAKKDFVNIFLMDDIAEREKAFLSINSNLNEEKDSLLTSWVALQQQHPVSKGTLLKQTLAGMVYKPDPTKPISQVLVVGSEADKIVATSCLENVAESLDSELYLHPEAGHGLPIDVPDWLADTVSYWVEETVVPFEFTAAHQNQRIETRQKDNGLMPLIFADKSVKALGDATDNTWEATKSGWAWLDESIPWTGMFAKERRTKDANKRKELPQAKINRRDQAAEGG